MGLDHRHSLLTMTAPSLPTLVQIQAKATSPQLGRGGCSLSHLPHSRSDVLCKAPLCGMLALSLCQKVCLGSRSQ